ncbi:hypothetical protein [Bacillus salipaludis]|nr:hypothetical protein [Bacillus salipaludis]
MMGKVDGFTILKRILAIFMIAALMLPAQSASAAELTATVGSNNK